GAGLRAGAACGRIAGRNAAAGEESAHLAGNGAIAIPTDVTDPDNLERAIKIATDHFGGLHVLHNNAGGSTAVDDTAVEAPLDEHSRATKLDPYGTFHVCRFGTPALLKPGGRSVNDMSSDASLTYYPSRNRC